MTDDRSFDRLLTKELTELPQEALPPEGAVNPWRRLSRLLVLGLAIQSLTVQVYDLDYVLPAVGCVLVLLAFRALRREDRWFRACWVLSLVLTVGVYAADLLAATPLALNQSWNGAAAALLAGIRLLLPFLLWRGLLAVQRKGGEEKPSAPGAFALGCWQTLLTIWALWWGNYFGWIAFFGMLGLLLCCLVSLHRLYGSFDRLGYQLRPAPVRLSDRLLGWGLPAVLLLAVLGCLLGFSQLPMDWQRAEPVSESEAAEREALESAILSNCKVSEPDEEESISEAETQTLVQALELLTTEELETLSEAEVVYWAYEGGSESWSIDFSTGRIYSDTASIALAAQYPSETGLSDWLLIHAFFSGKEPLFRGNECVQLCPRWREGGAGFARSSNCSLSGQLFCEKDGSTYTASYASFEEIEYTGLLGSEITDVVAQFTRMRGGENTRGYVSYWATHTDANYSFGTSRCELYRAALPLPYPYTTTKELVFNGGLWALRSEQYESYILFYTTPEQYAQERSNRVTDSSPAETSP